MENEVRADQSRRIPRKLQNPSYESDRLRVPDLMARDDNDLAVGSWYRDTDVSQSVSHWPVRLIYWRDLRHRYLAVTLSRDN